jgi:hypothetical protein
MRTGLILFAANDVGQSLFMLGFAFLCGRLVGDDAFGRWLAQALAGVRLHRLGDGKLFRRPLLRRHSDLRTVPLPNDTSPNFCFEVYRVVT